LIGDGPDRGRIAQIIQESGLSEDVVLLGIVPHEELNEILARCAIGIVTYPETGLNNIYCAPNKIIEYPRAGLPVVTTGQPLLQSLLERYKIGAVCRRNAHTTTTEAARTILSVVDSLAAYRRNLQRFLNDHQWTDEAKKLLNAVGELAER